MKNHICKRIIIGTGFGGGTIEVDTVCEECSKTECITVDASNPDIMEKIIDQASSHSYLDIEEKYILNTKEYK